MASKDQILLPQPQYDKKIKARDYLVKNFGAATVAAAETQVALDILVAMGIVKPSELVDMIEDICRRAEQNRMRQAGMDA